SSRLPRARSCSERVRGWRSANVSSSRWSSRARRSGWTVEGLVTAVSVTAGRPLVQMERVVADGADGDAALRLELQEAGAAVGPAVQLRAGVRASAHAPDRGGSSDDGRMVGTREHVVVRFPLVAVPGGVGPG